MAFGCRIAGCTTRLLRRRRRGHSALNPVAFCLSGLGTPIGQRIWPTTGLADEQAFDAGRLMGRYASWIAHSHGVKKSKEAGQDFLDVLPQHPHQILCP